MIDGIWFDEPFDKIVDIQDQLESAWIDQWFDYRLRRRNRIRAVVFLALATRIKPVLDN